MVFLYAIKPCGVFFQRDVYLKLMMCFSVGGVMLGAHKKHPIIFFMFTREIFKFIGKSI